MTEAQFDSWFAYHASAFSGLMTWHDRLPDPKATLAHWFRLLAPVELETAKAATDKLFAEASRTPPFDQHPELVRRTALAIAEDRRREDGQRAFAATGVDSTECPHCDDYGLVRVRAFGAMLKRATRLYGSLEKASRQTCGMRCNCSAGDRFSAKIPRFDPLAHDLVEAA